MKLISMVNFVLEEYNKRNPYYYQDAKVLATIHNLANFLQQPLTLSMLIPLGENGEVLEEPKGWKSYIQENGWKSLHPDALNRCRNFAQAKKNVIFDGFEYSVEKGVLYYNKNIFWVGKFTSNDKIEDLVKYNLTITQTAVEKFKLK